MKIPLNLAFGIYLICSKPALALSDLVTRQTCNEFYCADWDSVVKGINGAAGAAAGAINQWLDFSQPQYPETAPAPDTDPTEPQDSQALPAPKNPPEPNPDSEIWIQAPPPELSGCQAVAPSSNFDEKDNLVSHSYKLLWINGLCSQFSNALRCKVNTNIRPCEGTRELLIWPTRCDDEAQNTITAGILGGMDNKFLTSFDPLCSTVDGVAFWLAQLTEQQAEALRKEPAVGFAEPNPEYNFGYLSTSPVGTMKTGVPLPMKRRNLRKRGVLEVVKQRGADASLSFVSTPAKKINRKSDYGLFKQEGGPIQVFTIDTGLEESLPDFQGIISKWIFAIDVMNQPTDSDGSGRGSCVASKIGGKRFGVDKRAMLIPVKSNPSLGSLMDALGQVVREFTRMEVAQIPIKGWNVVHIAGGWKGPSSPPERSELIWAEHMKGQIERLLDLGVVVVVSAGEDKSINYGEITSWPAMLAASPSIPIITVGGVESEPGEEFGKRFAWSPDGAALTLSAPGNGMCANEKGDFMSAYGTDFASAVVAGLISYFLSIPVLQQYFIGQANYPTAIRDYLVNLSVRRYFAQTSVWNGIDATVAESAFDDLQSPALDSKNPDQPPNFPPWPQLPILRLKSE